jgi:3-(3-hydroxy-phenyl)propionate hydroxylase
MLKSDHKSLFRFGYRQSIDQAAGIPARHRVIIIGAGPVGMTLALDLAQRGVPCVLLDDADRIGEGSRAICFAKRTLEIFDRLGVADRMVEKGVVWQKGRVFLRDREIYSFDLLPEGGHKMPAFINLQQYYVEQYLVEAIAAQPLIDLRWRNKVVGIERDPVSAQVTIDTPDGPYELTCDWLVACDGARSPSRGLLELDFAGEVFDDQFLIADVKMTGDKRDSFPTERWFWFEPPFHGGQSALLHRQPDDIWRIDLQLGRDADAELERRPETVIPRIARMLGHDQFTLEWVSIYRFQCRRIKRFVHDRVIFAGDAAHQVSPFGARGANSGIQDADNLGWKLAVVLSGIAPPSLIATYDSERGQAADENISHSTRSTDFIAPRTPAERHFRTAALQLAAKADFAKKFVNSGRLSTPTTYQTWLSAGDAIVSGGGAAHLGAVLPDVALIGLDGRASWLLHRLGRGFTVLYLGQASALPSINWATTVAFDLAHYSTATSQILCQRFGAHDGIMRGQTLLVRPDQHVCARFDSFDEAAVRAALGQELGQELSQELSQELGQGSTGVRSFHAA